MRVEEGRNMHSNQDLILPQLGEANLRLQLSTMAEKNEDILDRSARLWGWFYLHCTSLEYTEDVSFLAIL